MPLLLASDFCRRQSRPRPVRLELLQLCSLSSPEDESLVVYVSMQFLRQASWIAGRVVWVERFDHDSRSQPNRTTARLRVLPSLDQDMEEFDGSVDPPVVYLSPLVAANLALHHGKKQESCLGRMNVYDFILPEAERVTLRCWGRPVKVMPLMGQVQERTSSSSWPLPPSGRLLPVGSLISVVSEDKQIYTYEVSSVSEADQGQSTPVQVGTSGLATKVIFEEPPLDLPCPQLPSFSDSLQIMCPHSTTSIPHPDVPLLVERFHMTTANAASADCIFSVVGSDDDHHVTLALQEAADASGRRFVDVSHSWAAYAYLCGATVSSGSWADKLQGLHLAVQQARSHAPSVLVLRVTEELSGDKLDRHDQESRIWSMLTQEIMNGAHVLVVLCTSSPLSNDGPLSQHFVTEPLKASYPDAAYTRHLWTSFELDDGMLELLRGRPCKEVEILYNMYQERIGSGECCGFDLLRTCCKQVDQERRHRSQVARIPSVHWQDIGGLDHVRREILDTIVLPLHYPHLMPKGGGRTGLLLFGPPGTGKTLVAKAVATELNLPFVSVKGPELMGSYIGESEENVRNVFENARQLACQNQPPASVLFFDELDSLAPRRGDHASGGNVTDRVVATLFAELDRVSERCTVFCLGATNRPDLLDPALLRPGRLDRLVYLGVDPSDHARILSTQIRNLRLEGDASEMAKIVAQGLPLTLTGADLSTIASAALVRAADRLCEEADEELAHRLREGELVTLDQVLASWQDNRLQPVVRLNDLLESAKNVFPSVSEEELARYEDIRDKFRMSM